MWPSSSAHTIRVILDTKDYAKYPFLREAVESIRETGLTLEDLERFDAVDDAKEKIKSVITRGEYPSIDDYQNEVPAFLTCIVILSEIGDSALSERFAVAFSKKVSENLKEEEKEERIEIAFHIASSVLGWSFDVDEKGTLIRLRYKDYLSGVPEYTGEWKLVNRLLDKGYVEVRKESFLRLIETGVKKYVLRLIEQTKVDEARIPPKLYSAVEEIASIWSKQREELLTYARNASKGKREDLFPPCIRAIIQDISAGKNLPHSARFALASFLLSVGFSVDEVLEVFKLSPDYREDIARYQVEHIAGMRGSRTKYLPYKCDNMRSYGLCRWRCENIRHPLQFFFKAARGRAPRVTELS